MSAGLAAALDLVDEGIAWREKLERDNDGGT